MMKRNIKLIIALVLFHFSTNIFSQEIIDYDEMWNNIKVSIEYDKSQVYSVDRIYMPNETITLMFGNIKTPDYPSMLFFIDDKHNAYWAHDCRYVFVNIVNNNTEIIDHLYPPKFLQEMSLLTPELEKKEAKLFDFSNIKQKVVSEKATGNNYAVIISGGGNGGTESSFLRDCEAFNSALKIYGYSEDNIYNLISDGSQYSSSVTVDYSATIENISLVFDKLSGVMTSDDRLFIYLMDHGGPFSVESPDWNVFICIKDGEILTDRTFAKEVDKISLSKITTVIGSCNGGGFFDDLSKENRVLISAAKYDEEALTDVESDYGAFEQHFIAALIEQDLNKDPVYPDANSDNYISIREAFYYAKDHDDFEEHPQYNSRDGDLGYKLTLNNESGTMNDPTDESWIPIGFNYVGEKLDCNPLNNYPEETPSWLVSHGSPKYHITTQNFPTNDIYLEAKFPSDASEQKSEGVFINLKDANNFPWLSSIFNGGHKYEIEVITEPRYGDLYLSVYATNGMISSEYSDCDLEKVPEISDKKLLYNGYVTDDNSGYEPTLFTVTFDKDEKYDQLWVYVHQPYYTVEGGLIITNINIVDKGIDISMEDEAHVYTPGPNSNLICCPFEYTIEGNPPLLFGTECEGGYVWQESSDNDLFTDIPNATSRDFDPPLLNKTTYYRRVVSESDISKSVKMDIVIPVCSSGKQIYSSQANLLKESHGNVGYRNSSLMGPEVCLRWSHCNDENLSNHRISDGVYANYNFKKNSRYLISFYVKQQTWSGRDCDEVIKVFAASGIKPGDDGHRNQAPVPDYDKRVEIYQFGSNTSTDWEKKKVLFIPNDNYESIWFYPHQHEWKCYPGASDAFYLANIAITAENVKIGPESFTDKNPQSFDGVYIETSGVTTVNSGGSLNLVATKRILLKPGFKSYLGSHFYTKCDDEIYLDCPSRSRFIVNSEIFKDEVEEKNEHKDEIIIIENTSELANDKTDGGDSSKLGLDNLNDSNIIIYPNPTNSSFYINYNGDISNIDLFEVYNSLGSLIETRLPRNNSEEFKFSDKPNGLYFIRIVFNDNSIKIRKILLNK